jgi:predicted RNA binding protein YcfA (HicA-like mRNA interferase family)
MPDLAQILELLDRDGALDLGESNDTQLPRDWPRVTRNEEVQEVDYGRLFPRRRGVRDGEDYEIYGDEWEPPADDLRRIFERESESEDDNGKPIVGPPLWDVWAWYQPIHFFGPDFGIFIREEALYECARRIRRHLPGVQAGWFSPMLGKALLRASFATLYLHEQYHHKTESFALRLHVVQQKSVFPAYWWGVYKPAGGSDDQIEEGLANADSRDRLRESLYRSWTGRSVLEAMLSYLDASFAAAPPGYRNAVRLRSDVAFHNEQNLLFAQAQEGRLKPRRRILGDFGTATHMNRGLFPITSRIYTVVRRGTMSALPIHPSIAPLKTRVLEAYLRRRGWTQVKGGGKGSHTKFRDHQGRMIVLPRAAEVSPGVLRATAETLGFGHPRDLAEIALER